jgi:hypothetical protein
MKLSAPDEGLGALNLPISRPAWEIFGSAYRDGLLGFALLASLSLGLGGCIASIKEQRVYGPVRPSFDAGFDVISERVPTGKPPLDASAGGAAAPAFQCRDITVISPMVRDVDITRSFANAAQERNAALLMLLAAGVGFLAYGANQAACPAGGCQEISAATTVEYGLVVAAAIPIGFLAYNAWRVRDSRTVERVAPEMKPGEWRPCSTREE